jgi:hypothetical protein
VFVPGVLACSAQLELGDEVAVSVAVEPRGSQHCGLTRGTVLPTGGGGGAEVRFFAANRFSLYR